MLKLINISKTYKIGNYSQKILNNISITFRKNEFVMILGESGSGKTTLLNIIGGLDKYDDGNIIINNKSTKKFKNKSWNSYRNNCVGFIFQNYNLINHISVLANVELALTLSGIRKKERKKRSIKVLEKVGLKDHIYKKPNQLSGGQMQRVAIARALVNNPSIILADEPTGALDSDTSLEIMDLIKEISKDKLVIMVTHNSELAKKYATRIIDLKDGKIIKDTNKMNFTEEVTDQLIIKKTSMNFWEALKLSFNNIKTKKGRTLLTSFASSIGIVGITLVLGISNGFNQQIDNFENNTLSALPLMITKEAIDLNQSNITNLDKILVKEEENLKKYPSNQEIYSYDTLEKLNIHYNKLTTEYLNYINNLDNKYYSGITIGKTPNMILLTKNNSEYKQIDLTEKMFPLPNNKFDKNNFVNTFFDVIEGRLPENKNELLLIVDNKNRIDSEILTKLGFNNKKKITFSDILNKEIKLVFNNDYYTKSKNTFVPKTNIEDLYNCSNNLTLKITGIIRSKRDKESIVGSDMGISYNEELIDYIISMNKDSQIIKEQKEKDYNTLTGVKFINSTEKENLLNYLGNDGNPSYIYIYPRSFEDKEYITTYLDKYNIDKSLDDKILYLDQAKIIVNLSSSIMNGITFILIAFSAVSLIVSSIMIGIITYISVLERTKEIGILKSLGASNKDILRVFKAEVFIIGLASGLLGLLIAYLLKIPLNKIIESFINMSDIVKFNINHMFILLIISTVLTLIGGLIPSIIASKKNIVDTLRKE